MPYGNKGFPHQPSHLGMYPTLVAPGSGALTPSPIKFEWEEMKNSLKTLKDGTNTKTFKFENDCPYPFDKSIMMTLFPKHFEVPKFDKFRGKSDPVTHVKESYMHCQEVAYNDVFLMWLFPKSLAGPTLEWFCRIPQRTIKIFVEHSESFVAQYAHLVETELSVVDLVQTK